jgi:hypothetical protein
MPTLDSLMILGRGWSEEWNPNLYPGAERPSQAHRNPTQQLPKVCSARKTAKEPKRRARAGFRSSRRCRNFKSAALNNLSSSA